jgi:hypothetical protein
MNEGVRMASTHLISTIEEGRIRQQHVAAPTRYLGAYIRYTSNNFKFTSSIHTLRSTTKCRVGAPSGDVYVLQKRNVRGGLRRKIDVSTFFWHFLVCM